MASHIFEKWMDRMCTAAHILSIHSSKMCEAPQFCVKVIRVIRQILQGCKQNQILSIHLLKIKKKNLRLQILHFCDLIIGLWSGLLGVNFSEGEVFHAELGNAKNLKRKCVRVLSIPKLLLKFSLKKHEKLSLISSHWC